MKNIFKILSFVILFFVLALESFAIDAPTNLSLNSSTESSVNLSWDINEEAFVYYVYYSKQSGLETGYEMQTDYVEYNSLTINDLEAGSTYYFVVVAFDENGNESVYSNEIIVDINDSSVDSSVDSPVDFPVDSPIEFALDSIEVLDYDKIILSFTHNIDNSEFPIREFKITNKNDDFDSFEVISTELNIEDSKVLLLTLDRNTTIGNEYEVVIIAITSADGKNIESGIDNTASFAVIEINEPVTNPIVVPVEPDIDLNSASEEYTGPSGENIEASKIENTTLALSESNENLPKTGPEHVLMLILSIILGALIFVFKYKKV